MTPAAQPWKTPAVGDTLTLRDGRAWTVTAVAELTPHQWPGEQRVSYDYIDAQRCQRKASPMLREFVSRMGRLVKDGAVYARGRRTVTVEVPVVDELPEDALMGDLMSWDGKLCARQSDGWLLVEPPSAEVAKGGSYVRAGGEG